MPPPEFTSRWTLPDGVVVQGRRGNLGEAFDRARKALRRGGFEHWSVYSFADDGFAIVARMEKIQPDGTPATIRFGVRRPPYRAQGFSTDDFIQVLFNAAPGRYRVLVLLVSKHPLDARGIRAAPLEDVDMSDLAAGKLPDELREKDVEGRCEVLVYELERPTEQSRPAQLMVSSDLTAKDHLIAAGVWRPEELQ
jgi:hypothetical protein